MLENLIQGISKAFRSYPVEERRQNVRLPCRYAVYILEGKKALEAQVIDFSPQGLRMQLVHRLRVGGKVELVYRGVPGGSLTRLPFRKLKEVKNKILCKVVWSVKGTDNYEAGVKFLVEGAEFDATWPKTVLEKMGVSKGAFDQKRSLIRAKACVNADLRMESGSVDGVMVNVGLGGAMFQSTKHLNVGEPVHLTVRSHPKLPPLRVKGIILNHSFDVVSNSGQHNIQFKEIDQQTLDTLNTYVKYLLKTEGAG